MRCYSLGIAAFVLAILCRPSSAQEIVGAYGTPTVDGTIEAIWNDVPSQSFQVTAGGSTVNASLKVMHDDEYLYLSLWVNGQFPTSTWLVGFDHDADGRVEEGDDVVGMVNGNYVDRHLSNATGRLTVLDDTRARGTVDGNGARRVSIARTTFEIRKPLDSGDSVDAVISGAQIGIYTSFACSNCTTGRLPPNGSMTYQNGPGPVSHRYYLETVWQDEGQAAIECRLDSQGQVDASDGVTGWSLAVEENGDCEISSATALDTAAEDVAAPSSNDGFYQTQILADRKGVVSGCILSFVDLVTLDLNDHSPLLRFFVAPAESGCGECRLSYREGLEPPKGQPVDNRITIDGISREPTWSPDPLNVDLCGCFAGWSTLGAGWGGWSRLGFNLDDASIRNRYRSEVEVCSNGTGYGSNEDSLYYLRSPVGPSGIEVRLEELSDGGQASVEFREQILGDEPWQNLSEGATCFRVTAHRRGEKIDLSAGFRATRGAVMQDIPLTVLGDDEFALPIRMEIKFSDGPRPNALEVLVHNESGATLEARADVVWPDVGESRFGMTVAKDSGERGQALFCRVDRPDLRLYGNDTDGDGCTDCEDEFPTRSMRAFTVRAGPCCTEGVLAYVYQGGDTDGDGILDCADPDDDGDGIPDDEDPCPLGPCDAEKNCCVKEWVACGPYGCASFFLLAKGFEKGRPGRIAPGVDGVVRLDNFEILNDELYVVPQTEEAGVTGLVDRLTETLSPAAGVAGGVLDLRLEIWEQRDGDERFVSRVGDLSVDLSELQEVDRGNYLRIDPSDDQRSATVGGAWGIGQTEEYSRALPDADDDGYPDNFDNCPTDANPDQADENGNGIGDVCDGPPIRRTYQVPGDANQDGNLDISDGVKMLGILFTGDSVPSCGSGRPGDPSVIRLLDVNGDRQLDLSDGVSVFTFLFLGGQPPALGRGCQEMPGCPDTCSP